MNDHLVKINKWLYPISLLYGMGVGVRNKLFDWGILRSKSFDVPTICIGNIAVGGTGKTPHTEFLIRVLQKEYNVAVLSRGYKRKTSGYVLAGKESSVQQIGDEPYQIKRKFPEITVAVDEKRVRGIERLSKLTDPTIDVVLLDDAFQHRYVKAGMNIVLTDFHRLFCDDTLLPAGKLREKEKAKNRAQMVIVTKCPETIKPIDFNIISKRLQLYPYQHLYFSSLQYGGLEPVFPESGAGKRELHSLHKDETVLLVTGIASPDVMNEEIQKYTKKVQLLTFSDHHNFKQKDIKLITEQFNKIASEKKVIITTEKDATRLANHPAMGNELKKYIYALPIETRILQQREDSFKKNIIDYVRKNKRNSNISKK